LNIPLVHTLRFLFNHPLAKRNRLAAFGRLIHWQIRCRLNPRPVEYPFVGGTKLLAWKGLTGVTGNIYAGLHEFEDMAFLLHFLRQEDFFADIGANVGSYTILAAGVCGSKTIAAEPLPRAFKILSDNVKINRLSEKTELKNIGIGAAAGALRFTRSLDTTNHVATPGETDTLEVLVETLDEILHDTPQLIKIDVEGYEMAVLRGAAETLANPALKALIIEINNASERYGHSSEEVHNMLAGQGFQPFGYEPFSRTLSPLSRPNEGNTIYLRDIGFVKERLETAKKVNVLGQTF
jgi:FkbM family methyltransferase